MIVYDTNCIDKTIIPMYKNFAYYVYEITIDTKISNEKFLVKSNTANTSDVIKEFSLEYKIQDILSIKINKVYCIYQEIKYTYVEVSTNTEK